MRIPFFHYTYLDSLKSILNDARLCSRYWLSKNSKKIIDISIDPKQQAREERGLLQYVPLFPGFYALWRDYELNGYLMREYDDPKVQNPSFYGTLNKVLRARMGDNYSNVVILLVDDELVYNFADQGKVRFFSDIAVKQEAEEFSIESRAALQNFIGQGIDGSNIWGEVDLLDDGKLSVACPSDIEAVVVDSDEVRNQVMEIARSCGHERLPQILVSRLPRNDLCEDDFNL